MEKMDSKISKMEEQVNMMAISVARIDERLKSLPDYTVSIKNAEGKISSLEKRLVIQETRGKVWNSLFGGLAGAISALVVGLLVKYFAG